MLTIYFNPACSKCRGSREILEGAGCELQIVEYLREPPDAATLEKLLQQLGMEPEQITRKGEDRWEELGLDRNPPRSRAEWVRVLCENPLLIERPIVSDGKRAVIGRPPENVRKLIDRE